MSGFARKVALVAGVVALAATGVGAGLAVAGFGAGLGIAGVGSFAAIASTAATISGVASFASGALAKAPPARGSATSTSIGTDQPMPYLIGETYYGGSREHQTGYGPTIDKVPNPYALMVDVYSGAGPVQGLVDCQAEFASLGIPAAGGGASGYASGFLWAAVQRGAVPESAALAAHWGGAPGWGADYRLSGYAAIAWSLLFDRKGKVFASGVPQLGAIWRGQLAWDPRQDSTFAGGQGAHRWAPPSATAAHDAARATWIYNECPGLQALRYVLGAWHRDPRIAGSTYQKVAGIGLPIEGVIVEDFIHLANVCDANGWKVGGTIFEPATGTASTRWANLKDILAAGGAEPCFRGGRLGLRISAPRISLDRITRDDLADDEIVVCTGVGWEERLNTLVPKYRSRDHKWEYVASTIPVSIAAQVAVDGEVKRAERQYNLVQVKDQAAQLCAYELLDRRELGEIEIVVKPRLRKYGPGDLLVVDLPEEGLEQQPCVILKRLPMPDRMAWKFTLRGETPGKHAFALGQTAVAPPIPALRSTEDLDGIAAPVESPSGLGLAIATSFPIGLTITATDSGAITISDHTRRYTDGHPDVAVSGMTIATRPPATLVAQGAVSIAGNSVTKTGQTNDWDAGAYSQNAWNGPVTVRFKAGENAAGFHAGLNTDPATNASYDSIDYAWNGWADGIARVYIGTVAAVVVGNYTSADTFSIQYAVENGQGIIRWFMNDVQAHQVDVAISQPLAFDCSLFAPGQSIRDVTLSGDDALEAGDFRAIYYDDPDRTGGDVAYGLTADDIAARVSPANPYRHYVGYVSTPTAGSPPANGGGATPPGGNCPTIDTPILMADRTSKPAGDLLVGDAVYTRHEVGFGWGVYPVEAVTIVESDDVWQAAIGGKILRATGDHLVYVGRWTSMRDLGTKVDGVFEVVKITVTSAHTYVSNGILSHNIKATQPDQ